MSSTNHEKIGQISEHRGTTGVMYNVKQRHYRMYNACRYSKTTDATEGAGNTYRHLSKVLGNIKKIPI